MTKNRFMILLLLLMTMSLAACGPKNDSPMAAAHTFMESVVEGDIEKNQSINRADAWSYPADYMMELAMDYELTGRELSEFTFTEDEENDRVIRVTWTDSRGIEKDWNLVFTKADDAYYFLDME